MLVVTASSQGLDAAQLECVAWSDPLRRFVPALGCELVTEPGGSTRKSDDDG